MVSQVTNLTHPDMFKITVLRSTPIVLLYYSMTVLLDGCIIALLYYCITVLLHYCITVLLYSCITVLSYYCVTVLLYCCNSVLLYYLISIASSCIHLDVHMTILPMVSGHGSGRSVDNVV
jgi:hypothetical protein